MHSPHHWIAIAVAIGAGLFVAFVGCFAAIWNRKDSDS